MVALGERNPQLKDFFDIHYLSSAFTFQGDLLFEAIKGTFERRSTPLPKVFPVALTDTFAVSNEGMWAAYLKRSELEQTATLADVIKGLRVFLAPVLRRWK